MRAMLAVRVVIFVLAFGFAGAALRAQSWEMPSDAQRCPSKWGAKDEIGSGNLMKPEMALKAAKLIHTGEVFTLGFHLSAALPLIGSRRFDLHTKRSTATDPGHARRERGNRHHRAWARSARSSTPSRTRFTAANTTTASRITT